MTFDLTIYMGNAAFEDGNGKEVARLLRDLAERIRHSELCLGLAGTIMDLNGNTCGSWRIVR